MAGGRQRARLGPGAAGPVGLGRRRAAAGLSQAVLACHGLAPAARLADR